MVYKHYESNTIYKRKWMRERRKEFFKDKSCAKCGTKTNLVIKWGAQRKRRINFSATQKRILAATKGKPILCRKHWAASRVTPIIHGHYIRGYRKGCKCPKCMSAMATYYRTVRLPKSRKYRIEIARKKLESMGVLPTLKKQLGTAK